MTVLLRTFLPLFVVSLAQPTPQSGYYDWFHSSTGLGMNDADATYLSKSEGFNLNACGVTIPKLQELRDVMLNGLQMSLQDVRSNVLLLAYQHVDASKLRQFYETLSSDLAMPSANGSIASMHLSKRRANPQQLKELYAALKGVVPQHDAQVAAIEMAAAGADASAFTKAYLAAKASGKSQADCMSSSRKEAVKADLMGLARRYAVDMKLYTAAEFQSKYSGDQWFQEWADSPLEQRVDKNDKQEYEASIFKERYGADFVKQWENSQLATQERFAADQITFPCSIPEFQQFYQDNWRSNWHWAPETSCMECGPYPGLPFAPMEITV